MKETKKENGIEIKVSRKSQRYRESKGRKERKRDRGNT